MNPDDFEQHIDIAKTEYSPNLIFNPNETSIARFLDNTVPPRQYILRDCLPLGKVGALVGTGGTGKSQLAIQIAIGVAANQPICTDAWLTNNVGSVLMFFAEEDEDELHRRVKNSIDSMSLDDAAIATLRANLHVKSLTGQSCLLTDKNEKSPELEESFFLDDFISAVNEYEDLKLIIIDPASRFRGGDENSAPDSTRFVQACEKIAEETGATVLLVHHTNKGSKEGEINQHAARGSSAFIDGVRWSMNVRTMSAKESSTYSPLAKPPNWYIQAQITKNNYGPPQAGSIWLVRGDHGVLDRINLASTIGSQPQDLGSQIIDMLSKDTVNKELHSVTSFVDKYAGKDNKFGVGRDKVKQKITQLLSDKLLIKRKATKDEKAMKRNFREVLICGGMRGIQNQVALNPEYSI